MKAKFTVRYNGNGWYHAIAMNDEARSLINGKVAALIPERSWKLTPEQEQEKNEIIRKADLLCSIGNLKPRNPKRPTGKN